jgi:hypothetical protein
MGLIGFERAVSMGKLRDYAMSLGLVTKINEKQRNDFIGIDIVVYTPQGVKLNGKMTDVMSFGVGGELQGNRKAVLEFVIRQAATMLRDLAPQVHAGVIEA